MAAARSGRDDLQRPYCCQRVLKMPGDGLTCR